MKLKNLGVKSRLQYLWRRARGFDAASLTSRARAVAGAHGKPTPIVLIDMLWSAAFRNVAFQDYVDYDFAMLTRAERATFMTRGCAGRCRWS